MNIKVSNFFMQNLQFLFMCTTNKVIFIACYKTDIGEII